MGFGGDQRMGNAGGESRRWRSSCFAVLGLQAAALEPRINPAGDLGPQAELGSEQRVDFEAAQLPPLFIEHHERSFRKATELVPQFLIRQETADDSFNRSL